MSVVLSEAKTDLVASVAADQGLQEYKVDVQVGSMKGDGYLGIINTVHLHDAHQDLHLIMKSAMSAEELRETAPVRKAYEREIYMYETIFPHLDAFSEENDIRTRFSETARCYGSLFVDQEECLLLEDLKVLDYKLWDRMKAMDEEHVALVFTSYAKLHGTALALKLLQPGKFEEFCGNLVHIFQKEEETEEDVQKFGESAKQVFSNGFRALGGDQQLTKAFADFAQNCKSFFYEDLRRRDKFFTILHGDCWCNNMMFKYGDDENPSKPTEMRLLDWQISHVGSPICDLSYFFYACGSKEVLHNLPKYLKVYHETLSRVVKEAGLDPEEVFSYEELEEQWKKFSKFGLFMALFVMKIILSDVEEAPDFIELAKEGKDILESVTSSKSVNIEAVDKRIYDVIAFMVEYGYL